jgi:hypothetical protein
MLAGLRSNEIIVGAYANDEGVCPMLAAHRAGGRTSFVSFARAWDRFGFRDGRGGAPRRATQRELLLLRTHLEASLLEDEGPAPELGATIAEHRGLLAQRPARPADPARLVDPARPADPARLVDPARPGDVDRSNELRMRSGWSWMRVVRRYDEYAEALVILDRAERRLERERVG